MAERRMFAKTIIDSDAFLDMPLSTQALYFHLSMRADDEGFVNNPKKIQRMIAASEDDLKVLLMKNFIIAFESGVVVIKHWRIHNYIQKDRYKATVYQEERAQMTVKDNGVYTMDTECVQDAHKMDSQYRLVKDRLVEDSLVEDKEKRTRFTPPSNDEAFAYFQAIGGTEKQSDAFLDYYESKGWKVGTAPMKDWKAAARNWVRRDKKTARPTKASVDDVFAQVMSEIGGCDGER